MPDNYEMSQTLRRVLHSLNRDPIRPMGRDANVVGLAFKSALIAREQRGIESYGKTLDDQKLGSHTFWIRMACEEFLDGLMYIQKALDRCYEDGIAGFAELEHMQRELGVAAYTMMRWAHGPALDALANGAVNPKLFPPCDMKEESSRDRPETSD